MTDMIRKLGFLCLAAAGAGAVLQGCKLQLGDPMAIGSSMSPFERLPYVQAVDTASAYVVWLAAASAHDSVRYRERGLPDWRSAVVFRDSVMISGSNARLLTRRARLVGLSPGVEVEYEVWGDDRRVGPLVFRTAPRTSRPAAMDSIVVLAYGDSGWGSPAQVQLAALMEKADWDLAVHVGDIAYYDGSDLDFTLRHFHIYQDLLARTPFFPAPGNHDLRADGAGPYRRAFVWPDPTPGALYYTYKWGDIQFIVLDTTDESGAGAQLRNGTGPQIEWLQQTLAAADQDPSVRWLVTYMHHPLYSHATGFSGHGSDERLQAVVGPLLDRYGVDLVLAGHDHHYERSRPILSGSPVEPGCGPVYVLTGGGGGSQFARAVQRSKLTAATSTSYQFVRLVVRRAVIEGFALDTEGAVIDRFAVRAYEGPGADDPRCGPIVP